MLVPGPGKFEAIARSRIGSPSPYCTSRAVLGAALFDLNHPSELEAWLGRLEG